METLTLVLRILQVKAYRAEDELDRNHRQAKLEAAKVHRKQWTDQWRCMSEKPMPVQLHVLHHRTVRESDSNLKVDHWLW
jgi:hypothetical protein